MKKIALRAAACIMGLSLFLCTQPVFASIATIDYSEWENHWDLGTGLIVGFDSTRTTFEPVDQINISYNDPLTVTDPILITLTLQSSAWNLDSNIVSWDDSDDTVCFITWYVSQKNPNNSNIKKITYTIAPDPVPVPTAALLLGSGLMGLVCFRRRFGK